MQQVLETQHAEKKAGYDAAVGALESQVAVLGSEVSTLCTAVNEAESQSELLACQLQVVDANLKRLANSPGADKLKDRWVVCNLPSTTLPLSVANGMCAAVAGSAAAHALAKP